MTFGNLTQFIASTGEAAEAGAEHGAWWAPIAWMGVVFVVICVLLMVGLRGARTNVPKSYIARLAEHGYLFIEDMCVGVIGQHGKKYIPLVLTIYLVILFSNMFGFVGLFAPTASLGFTLGLAVVVIFYVQYEGIRVNGFVGYIKHFMGPNLGMPILAIFITPLLFFIEIVSEVAKNLSLSLRLQGNISGEHMVGQTLGGLIPISDTFSLPLQAVLLPLGVFVSLVQALVFTMLTCVYLSLFTAHEAEPGHAH